MRIQLFRGKLRGQQTAFLLLHPVGVNTAQLPCVNQRSAGGTRRPGFPAATSPAVRWGCVERAFRIGVVQNLRKRIRLQDLFSFGFCTCQHMYRSPPCNPTPAVGAARAPQASPKPNPSPTATPAFASAPAPASRPRQNQPRRVPREREACGSHEQYMKCGCQEIVVAVVPGHCFKTSKLNWLWGAQLNSAIEPRSAFLYAECMLYYNLLSRFGGISKFQ